ncbi:MAG TPA: acetyl-CoA carboxylase carboxyltransferase subunit alpha [Rectinemataceae bacterium]|nr:acetyl-CoA carboxylase carboxyltransferase subunit alpha [Rectinemataceae bacterium]
MAGLDAAAIRERLDALKAAAGDVDISAELAQIELKLGGNPEPPAAPGSASRSAPRSAPRSAMDRVRLARLVGRPTMLDYVDAICEDFLELHGDRSFGDDPAMVGGIGQIDGKPFTIIGQHRGRNLKETIYRKNGMAEPEGYRKALRLAHQAEKFGRPVVVFIDTQGAFPGVSSEERGIGEAIARNLKEFSLLRVPIICFIIGEAESGGALGIAVGDELWMLENAVYSVISPEGCASILLRDANKAAYAAGLMKITATDLLAMGVVDGIIREPEGGAQLDPGGVAREIKARILESSARLSRLGGSDLLAKRFDRYCRFGAYAGGDRAQEGFLRRFLFEA